MLSRRQLLGVMAASSATLVTPELLAQSAIDPTSLTLAQASSLIRQQRLSPVTLTEAYLARIASHNPLINAYITVTGESAMAQAQQLTEELRQGRWRGPLHGIPIALKDNIDTAGIPTTAANRLLAKRIPEVDAPVWQKLKAKGAILLGKLNMHEFAYGGTSSVSHVGPVHNPWNLERIPGGSSGGSAAAVAAHLCAAALGTDTLASIRLPASYCGVVGLKPTHGLSSIRGIIPVSESLDHVGPLARNVEDCLLVLQEMAGCDPLDSVSIQAPTAHWAESLLAPVQTLRIGLPQSPYFEALHPDVESAVGIALEVLRQLTASVQDVQLPEGPDFALLLAESYAWHKPLLDNPANHPAYHPATLERLLAAGQVPVEDYIHARQQLQVVRNRISQVFTEVDVLVTPTAVALPELISQAVLGAANSAEPSVRNTAPFNLYGIPTISIPCGFSSDGLPIGLQLSSARLNEAALFALAHAYAQVTDWHTRSPMLA